MWFGWVGGWVWVSGSSDYVIVVGVEGLQVWCRLRCLPKGRSSHAKVWPDFGSGYLRVSSIELLSAMLT